MAEDKCGKKMIAVNREVRHEYFVIEALETGIELVGTEVKSLRAGGVNLKDSWADIDDCLLYTSPSPRDRSLSRMPSSA